MSPLAARRPAPSAFNLFASAIGQLSGNRVYCGFRAIGEFCVNVVGSPILGGGDWPYLAGQHYIFNSGLQIAALVPSMPGFAWSGDTVGSWFMDPRGDQQSGTPVTSVFDSRYQGYEPRRDFADWPSAAVVRDTALFTTELIGREAVSDQDTWVRYWDGNANQTNGRGHPMGVLVEQRTLQWNYPNGNDDIVYRIYRIINVTASDPAAYAGLATLGYTAADIAEVVALGANFRSEMQRAFGVTIPAAGYPFSQVFLSWYTDSDIGTVVTDNFSTAVLPFGVATGYVGDFAEPSWQFAPEIFTPPLAPAPGFAGQAFLRTPGGPVETRGLHMWSNAGMAWMPDPSSIGEMYRYLAVGSGSCSVPDPVQQHVCVAVQTQRDTRDFMSSGPFTVAPGQAVTLVMALVMAAPVAAPIAPYIGAMAPGLQPGFPPGPAGLATGNPPADTVRVIDRAMGWVTHADADADGLIQMDEVTTVSRSLLWKTQLANAMAANRFLLPSAPAAPDFHLLPGDGRVTVVWRPSATEVLGDPYADVAADPATPLYDPNYRRNDVEGYRIWRGTSPSNLQLVAQFDYDDTWMLDYTALVIGDNPFYPRYGSACAPELGITTSCPALPDTARFSGDMVQVRPGERAVLANGLVAVLRADTAFGRRGLPPLSDTGVPFAFTDSTAQNGQTYYYAVTAFDVNSFQSGPSSLESARVLKPVRARVAASTRVTTGVTIGQFGDDTVALDAGAAWSLDTASGRFSGSPPPTNALTATFAPFVPVLLPALNLELMVDSLRVHSAFDFPCGALENGLGTCAEAFVTFRRDGAATRLTIPYLPTVWSAFGGSPVTQLALGAVTVNADSAAERRFGLPSGFSVFTASATAAVREHIRFSSNEGQAARRSLAGPAFVSPGGSRWFDGANETVDHPGYGIRVGHLTGVDTVWAPIHHTDTDPATPGNQIYSTSGAMQCFSYTMAGLGRQADVQVTWGAGGTITSVRDITHRVAVEFKLDPQATYGFMPDANGDGVISWTDFNYLETASQNAEYLGFCNHTDPGPGLRARLRANPVFMAVSTAGAPQTSPAATGTGFGMYINGERYIFQLPGGVRPAAGTVWTLRTYTGIVRALAGANGLTPNRYRITRYDAQPLIPGLRVVFRVPEAEEVRTPTAADLARVHTVPDPYYVSHGLEAAENRQLLRFVNVPERSVIRIYSTSGILVAILSHNDATFGGDVEWDVRNRTGTRVASGVYFWHLETPEGGTRIGRFVVINGSR